MKHKIKDQTAMKLVRTKLAEAGKSLVFTNGCFDIIHRGHVLYLEQAASLGDYLIVGLNSDASVKRLKGESRPVNNQDDRALVLAALQMVDYVTVFEEDTPYNLIKLLKPDVLVKGGDWKSSDIVGSDIVIKNGGKVYSLDFYKGYSTTGILEKAR